MATLADVARRAGVSSATASRIINGSSKPVAGELRERVLAAVAELQYVPNAHAQLLARPQRSVIGVIVHDVSDPYFAEITRGLQRVATDHGRLVIICNSYRDPDKEVEYVELLRAQQVAAIVLAGSGYQDAAVTAALEAKLRAYQAVGGRVAVIGRHEYGGDAVVPDNEAGGHLLGAELYAAGHRRIGVIAGPRGLTTTT
ncbi:LacI family DNA-binding transcriptional regulator, partial [Micromonospora zhanjiangensis]